MNDELAERVAELRRKGRTPKEVARALGLKPADVTPLSGRSGRRRPAASCLGFKPHPDFAKGAALLGDWEMGSSDVIFGRDGKPFYMNGPCDDTYGNIAKLQRAVGDGNPG